MWRKDQLISANWLKIMVTIMTRIQQAVMKMWSRQNSPSALQLVYTDDDGKLQLDERVVKKCFRGKKCPLGLICVIGERQKGKSTLLNYILRVLHCLERGQPVSLGPDDEPLTGFEWRDGNDSEKKGIWIWSKPFILKRNGEEMAVFVLDTEGSLDIDGDQRIGLKLSALSMLLSSHLIFNVNAIPNTTELDYLEVFVNGSKLAGDSSSLQYLQHLDLLMRDWQDPDHCDHETARTCLQNVIEKLSLREGSKNNLFLDTLKSPSASGFLLPHPGERFLKSSQGTLADMDEGFRDHLTTYISDLVEQIWRHQKTDISGEKITCGHVGKELKHVVSVLQREECSFTSLLQMLYFLINWTQLKTLLQEYQEYLDQQMNENTPALKILEVNPSEMSSRVSKEAVQLQEEYQLSLRGDNSAEKEMLMEEMKSLLTGKKESFCTKYSRIFSMYTMNIGSPIAGTGTGPGMFGWVAGEGGSLGQHSHSSGDRDGQRSRHS